MALSRAVSEIFNVEKCRDLEMKGEGDLETRGQRSLKVIESCTTRYTAYGFLLVFFSNFVPKTQRF